MSSAEDFLLRALRAKEQELGELMEQWENEPPADEADEAGRQITFEWWDWVSGVLTARQGYASRTVTPPAVLPE